MTLLHFVFVLSVLLVALFSWYIEFSVAQVELCQANCVSSDRLVGPDQPTEPKTHPWASAPFPSSNGGFCKLGCQIFYMEVPKNTTCKRMCGYFYRYEVTVGYSHLIEEARLECENGCDIAVQVCQAGYYCNSGLMLPCEPGTYREAVVNVSNVALEAAGKCTPCPYGRYRSADKGKSANDCSLCPVGTYANVTGSKREADCSRCPAGMNAEEPGMRLCKCITPGSCELELNGETFFKNGEDFYRETVPFVGRW
jgi:hypothetical protein